MLQATRPPTTAELVTAAGAPCVALAGDAADGSIGNDLALEILDLGLGNLGTDLAELRVQVAELLSRVRRLDHADVPCHRRRTD